MIKVGVQTKGILPEMGLEEGVALLPPPVLREWILTWIPFLKIQMCMQENKFFF